MYLREPIWPEANPSRTSGKEKHSGRERTERPCCLIAAVRSGRGLVHALAQHLASELPGLDFALTDRPGIDAVWLCGYERGHAALVRAWRARHPHAILLVTGREPAETWAEEVLAAGADHGLAWPVDLLRLARLLHSRRFVRPA